MKRFIIALGFFALATTQYVRAQSANPDTATLHFLTMASIANLQEVATSQLAVQQGKRDDVKSFGSRMVTDHTNTENKLLALAKANGYHIPVNATTPPVDDPILKKASGDEFDRLYVHLMGADHRSALALFGNYAIAGKDLQVRAFAMQTLPVLKGHLAMINGIDDKIKYETAK